MPTLAEGEARTIVVNPSGPPTNTMTAILPPGVTISLESVLAAIDASGAGDTTALLEIADSSGAVIARKAQGQVVTGGVVGSATWALRLGDEGVGGGITEVESTDGTVVVTNPFGPVVDLSVSLPAVTAREFVFGTAVMPATGAYAGLSWSHTGGAALLGYTNPLSPTVLATGVYAWSLAVQSSAAVALPGAFQAQFAIDLSHADEEHWFQTCPNTSAVTGNPGFLIGARVTIGVVRALTGNRQMNMLAAHGGGAAGISADMFGVVQRLR